MIAGQTSAHLLQVFSISVVLNHGSLIHFWITIDRFSLTGGYHQADCRVLTVLDPHIPLRFANVSRGASLEEANLHVAVNSCTCAVRKLCFSSAALSKSSILTPTRANVDSNLNLDA